MISKSSINEFMAHRTLALVGASRSGKKFGNSVLRELSAKGYRILPVHPSASEIDGKPCYRSLRDLPEQVSGVIVVVPPAETERVVAEARDAGITRVWMQQGAESPEAIRYCADNGVREVHGECILMFAPQAAFPHRAHRFFRGIFRRRAS